MSEPTRGLGGYVRAYQRNHKQLSVYVQLIN
jgi:hypothetical protein